MYDHNLFQAICRTNRLDGEDKDYGHIVDFKELFKDVQEAIAVYSSEELDIDEGNRGSNNVALRISFYKAVPTFARAYAAIAQELIKAGYSENEAAALRCEMEFYSDTRAAIKERGVHVASTDETPRAPETPSAPARVNIEAA